MNVLAVVATVPGLPRLASQEELARIQEAPGITMRVVTDATAPRVARMLALERYDVLLWIGHGGAGYLVTGDGQVDPHWLAVQLKARAVHTAIIATCNSGVRPENGPQAAASFADALPAAGIDTITMQTTVSDRAAIEFDVELLTQLASGASLRQAYQVALNRAAQHGGVTAPMLNSRDAEGAANALRELGERMGDVQDSIKRLEERVGRVEARLDEMAQPHGSSRGYMVLGVGIMFAMLILLIIVAWRVL